MEVKLKSGVVLSDIKVSAHLDKTIQIKGTYLKFGASMEATLEDGDVQDGFTAILQELLSQLQVQEALAETHEFTKQRRK